MRASHLYFIALGVLPLLGGCAAAVIGGAAATGAYIAQDRRSVGSLVDDQVIELKSKQALNSDPATADGRIFVSSFNGVVLLAGEVPTEAAKTRAVEIVRGNTDVKKTIDELRVAPIPPVNERATDTRIEAEVKTRLLTAEDHPGLKVKVTTANGVVYLQGLVKPDEGDWAAQVASHVSGVTKVVKLFEYLS